MSRDTAGRVDDAATSGSRRFAEREAAARARRVAELDRLAPERDRWRERNRYYYDRIEALCRFVVPAGARVLEIGCGTGDLLSALRPSYGVGVDVSPAMIDRARERHGTDGALHFLVDDAETLELAGLGQQTFDYVVMSDVVGMLHDVWAALRAVRRFCNARTRLLVTYYNFAWEPLLRAGATFGLKMPIEQQNWLGMDDIKNLLELNHFEVVRSGTANLLPVEVPLLSRFANTWLAGAPGLRHLALTQYFVARLAGGGGPIPERDYRCSVVVPCRNELGNVEDIVERPPQMGRGTELIFVDGNSTDGTVQAIEKVMAERAGGPTFADAGGALDDQILRLLDPPTANKGLEQQAVEAAATKRETFAAKAKVARAKPAAKK